ncbi:MAG: PAS domain-containing protein [Gammaproteobacteria bacterium]|nr:PAS domain-containing protein [Gammaproteobacteria bacterium]MCP5199515.1 PAS domain-containing protein [Gammaproteobacteria bacterium]
MSGTPIDDHDATGIAAQVLAAVPTAVLVIDSDGIITLANPSAEAMFAAPPRGLVGVTVERLVPPDVAAAHTDLRRAYLADPASREMGERRDLTAVALNGREFPVMIGLTALTPAPQPLVIANIVDLTRRHAELATLREQAERLAESNTALEQFAFLASHDLQEPLRTIQAYSGRLRDSCATQLDARGRDWLQKVHDGAERMSTLVRDLLRYSRARTQPLLLGACVMDELMAELVVDLQTLLDEHAARVEWSALPTVTGDRTLLAILLRNLVVNAMRYRSAQPPRVKLACTRDGDTWHFTAQDNGRGIDARHLERIFLPFKRLHARDRTAGNGMGLALCRAVAERHGGRLWAESSPGVGATFHFTLPLTPVPAGNPGEQAHEAR